MADHFSEWGPVPGMRYVVRGMGMPVNKVLQGKWQRTSYDPVTTLRGVEEEWRDVQIETEKK